MDLIQLLEKLRKQAEKADNLLLQQVIDRYLELVKRLDGRIDALLQKIINEPENIQNTPQFKALIDEIEQELSDFSSWLAVELKAEINRVSLAGAVAGIALLSSALNIPQSDLQPVLPNALDILQTYLANDNPMMQKIRALAQFNTERVKQIILDGVALGRNPLTIAEQMRSEGLGIGLTDSMRWTRTLQNYSYRWATLAGYKTNGVEAWIWWAELDERVCTSCVSLHGQVFKTSDGIANDHHNGRCAMIPYIEGVTSDLANPNAGLEWFNGLSESEQRTIMGNKKWEAWKVGKFEFSQLSTTYDNDVFGTMRSEASLAELGIE